MDLGLIPDPILTADDIVSAGACRAGVVAVMLKNRLPTAVRYSRLAWLISTKDQTYLANGARRDGDGDGDGYGDGSGYGSGDGDGDGYGDGSGSGYGSGDGDGYGDGYGCG